MMISRKVSKSADGQWVVPKQIVCENIVKSIPKNPDPSLYSRIDGLNPIPRKRLDPGIPGLPKTNSEFTTKMNGF